MNINRLASLIAIIVAICSWAVSAFAVDVHITRFESVPTNTTATIEVMISPESNTNQISLEIRTLTGTGAAGFMPALTTNAIMTVSTNLTIQGSVVSSPLSNMVLEARSGLTVLDSNVFSVVSAAMISSAQAISNASNAIVGTVDLQQGAPITAVLSGKIYVVTFGVILPADTLGPDYAARVTVDAFTGDVLSILGSS